ncbi:hypothetical protein [Brucella intermedia]|nr:hypothetical protein [Brucella intermedia]
MAFRLSDRIQILRWDGARVVTIASASDQLGDGLMISVKLQRV